jgi:formylglycine-generating enzyme required for sulfatase activity
MVRITLRPRKVWVRFTSEPAGAWVSSRNVRLGQTPFRTRILPRWWRFRLAKKGYVTETEDRLIRPSTGQHVHFLVGGAKRMVKGTQMHFVKGSYFPRGSDSSDVQFGRALCRRHSRQSLPCRDSWFTAEQPRRSTFLSSFWIDATEVTVRAYRRCVLAGVCRPFRYQQKVLLSPVVGVSWKDAYTYCHWRQARLPTEAEWEMAARGRKGLRFPWGNLWKPKMANHGQFLVSKKVSGPASIDGFRFAAPVRSFAQGRSPYGLWQMAGNVAEWVADCYYTSYYRQAPERNPVHQPKSCTSRVIRGGSWMQPPWELRATARLPLPPATQSLTVGFRCAQSVPTKPIKKANR